MLTVSSSHPELTYVGYVADCFNAEIIPIYVCLLIDAWHKIWNKFLYFYIYLSLPDEEKYLYLSSSLAFLTFYERYCWIYSAICYATTDSIRMFHTVEEFCDQNWEKNSLEAKATQET